MRYLRRFVWHVAYRLMIVCIVMSLCLVTFYYAMNLSNIQVIVKDGMAARAQVVMMEADSAELNKFFFSSFLQNDAVLQTVQAGNSPYQNYRITGIDHRIDMGFVWLWPWDTSARFVITETIPHIDGRVKSSKADEVVASDGAGAIYPPHWQGAKYRISLTKENGQWLIKSLTWIENVE